MFTMYYYKVKERGGTMSLKKDLRDEIKTKMLLLIKNNQSPFLVLDYYKISKQTIYKYLKELIVRNIIQKKSKSQYSLSFYIFDIIPIKNENLYEDIVYKNYIDKYEDGKKNNVVQILVYTFTEILNNAIDHSEGTKITILYAEDFFNIYVCILDNGVGIFKKITRDHNLKNENEAIFELKKGKLTSDTSNHSGEGIFFTSKVVDTFVIESYNKQFYAGDKKFFYSFQEIKGDSIKGTLVNFVIDKNTDRIIKDVFDKYTEDEDDMGIFNKTEITVHLAKEYLDFPMFCVH